MDLYEFNILSLDERCQFVWKKGTFLVSRSTEGFKINLYFVGKFYAEVWYDDNTNEIKNVKSFKSRGALKPYIDLINLDELM